MKWLAALLVIAGLMLLPAAAAGADDEGGNPEKAADAAKAKLLEVQRRMAELKRLAEEDDEAAAKLQELDAQQKALMERLKKLRAVEQDRRMEVFRKPREGGDRKGRRELEAARLMLDPMFTRPPDDMGVVAVPLNPRDAALFDVARVLCKTEKFDEAIQELGKVAAGSPDKAAVSAAHFSIGNLYRRNLGDADKAIEHYSKVEGELQERAFRAMIETFEELGEIERAGQFLEKRILLTEDKPSKVRLLNQLAQLYMRNEENEKAIDVFRRIPETITYEEAERMEKIGPPHPPTPGPEMMGLPGDVFQFREAGNARVIQRKIGPDGEQVIIMEDGPVIMKGAIERMKPEGKREK